MSGTSLYIALFSIAALALFGTGVAIYYYRPRTSSTFRQVAGSRIALSLSDSFAPSDRFSGFVDEKSGASIVLTELPFPAFDQLQKLENAKETFAVQGVRGVTQITLPNRQGDYLYLRGEQNTSLVEYAKYILIFRDSGLTGMVTANIPRAALTSGAVTGDEIESILASATVLPDVSEGPKLFTLAYLGPFEEDLSLLGTTKAYRLKSGELEHQQRGLQPLFLVAPSLTQAPIPSLKLFAEITFNGIDQIREKALETTNEVQIAGLQAAETVGRGVDATTGEAALVYQLVIEARHGGYFRLIGLAPGAGRERYLEEFRKMAESFRPGD